MRRRERGRHAAGRDRSHWDVGSSDELADQQEPDVPSPALHEGTVATVAAAVEETSVPVDTAVSTAAEEAAEQEADGDGRSEAAAAARAARRRRAESEPAGWSAPLAAIGLVLVLLIVGALAYRWLVLSKPVPDTGASAKPQVVSGSAPRPAQSPDPPPALTALAPFAPVAGSVRMPLPGNPELTERLFVVAAGDVIMDRRVSDMIESEGGAAPLEDVAHILRRGDVAILNLETPLSKRGSPAPGKDVTFRGNPDGVAALRSAGVDLVSLANNHALDYGDGALADTIDLLDRNRIAHAGAGANSREAWRPAIVNRNGKRVAYLAFSYIEPGGFVADSDSAGIAGAKEKADEIAAAVRSAKSRADFVIVSFHWGVEYTDYPIDEQRDLGHTAIDAGADMVAAHHPHVIQGIEVYKDKLIAYSLGDFVFDHYSRKTGEAFILEAKLNRRKTLSARAIPVYLTESGKPQVVTGDNADSILGRLKNISSGFGTRMRISNSIATLQLP